MSSVHVVIPCYNYGRYLRQCVASALAQEGVDVRVLIIDDCSGDDTPDVGAKLAAEDSRVEFRRHAVNRGHIATYNEGLLGWAGGDYCLLLSADDLLAPGAFKRAVSVMERHPQVTMTYGRALVTENPDASSYVPPEKWNVEITPGADYIRRSCRTGENPVWTPTALVRTAVQLRIGGYRPDLPHAGDMEMWHRCAALGSIANLDCLQAYYRRHQTQMNTTFRGLEGVEQKRAVFDLLLAEYGSQYPDLPELHRLAMKKLSDRSVAIAHTCLDRGDFASSLRMARYAREVSPRDYSSWGLAKLQLKRFIGPKLSGPLRDLHSAIAGTTNAPKRQDA